MIRGLGSLPWPLDKERRKTRKPMQSKKQTIRLAALFLSLPVLALGMPAYAQDAKPTEPAPKKVEEPKKAPAGAEKAEEKTVTYLITVDAIT